MRAAYIIATLPLNLGVALAVGGLALQGRSEVGVFNPPKAVPFLTLDLKIGIPANVSTPDGPTGLAPNREGGKVKGAFEADILPLGAAYERVVENEVGENSFYQNMYIFQTAENETLSLDVDGILHYDNNALHGFGFGKIATSIPQFLKYNYQAFVIEVEGDFNTGTAVAEVFELKPCGRRDGKPIKALLPPGV
ncbi:hypothetical protein FDECE_17366, partial [Fusarium decemcellulare]